MLQLLASDRLSKNAGRDGRTGRESSRPVPGGGYREFRKVMSWFFWVVLR
jgi:hypothetical protein